MPSKIYQLALLSSLISFSAISMANEEEKDEPFVGVAELGYLQTTGNTETSSAKGKIDLTFEQEFWRHNAVVEGFGATNEEVTTSERYLLTAKSDYKFTDKQSGFVSVRYEDDRFGNFDYQATISVGYGNRLVNTKEHRFDFQVGPGYRRSEPVPTLTDTDPDTLTETILHLGWKYRWKFSETARFTQNTTADAGDENTFVIAETAVSSDLTGALALKVAYIIRHNTDVAPDKENTDAETSIAITYQF